MSRCQPGKSLGGKNGRRRVQAKEISAQALNWGALVRGTKRGAQTTREDEATGVNWGP